jgi:hypothetical protein
MRLCWADKIPLALFGVITLILLFLGLGQTPDTSDYCRLLRLEHPTWTHADSYCFVTAAQHWSAFVWIEGFLFLKIVLPVWVVVRLIDLFGGGPAIRRRARDLVTIDVPTADIEMPQGRWPSLERD